MGRQISPEEQAKAYSTDELAALSKLPTDVVEQLSMFGLIEVRDGLYGFRDLAAARQAAQLLGSGIGLSVITKSLREIRKWLPDARLSNLRLFPESKDQASSSNKPGAARIQKGSLCCRLKSLIISTPTKRLCRRNPLRRPATSSRLKASTGVS